MAETTAVKIGRIEEQVKDVLRRLQIVEDNGNERHEEQIRNNREIMAKLDKINNTVNNKIAKLEFTDSMIQAEVVTIKNSVAYHDKVVQQVEFFAKNWKSIILFQVVSFLIGLGGVVLVFVNLFNSIK